MNAVSTAKNIALKVHSDQVDKKNYPYMAHIIDVASRVAHLGESYEIVGLLHDVIEDADPVEFQTEVIADINVTFDYEISEAITAMTKNVGENYFEEYLPRLRDNKIALQVKIADASHNLSKAHLIQETELQDKLRTKYIKVLNELGMIGSAMERPLVYENGQWIEVA